MSRPHDRVIRASEIGRYVYCAHAWWLGSVQGVPSSHQQEMTAGEATHLQHGLQVRAWLWSRYLAYAALLAAAVVGIIWAAGQLGR